MKWSLMGKRKIEMEEIMMKHAKRSQDYRVEVFFDTVLEHIKEMLRKTIIS